MNAQKGRESEKQAELCNVKVESKELALPDKQAHRLQKPHAALV